MDVNARSGTATRVQYGYVVPDVEVAIVEWARMRQVAPWVLFGESMGDREYVQGDRRSSVRVSTALARTGSVEIELIQPLDDSPSIFQEGLRRDDTGLHHIGIWTTGTEHGDALVRSGLREVARIDTARGAPDIRYLGRGGSDLLLELIPLSPERLAMSSAIDAVLRKHGGEDVERFASPSELVRRAFGGAPPSGGGARCTMR